MAVTPEWAVRRRRVELIVESAASARAPKVEEAGDHDHPEYRARCQRIFGAVLEEDATHLQYVRDVIAELRRQIDDLA
jgi:hypothetical protein